MGVPPMTARRPFSWRPATRGEESAFGRSSAGRRCHEIWPHPLLRGGRGSGGGTLGGRCGRGLCGRGFAFLLFADDPEFDVGLEVGGKLHRHRVGVHAAQRFVELHVVGVHGVAELLEFLGNVALADRTEEVAFVVGVAGQGDLDALERGDELFLLLAEQFHAWLRSPCWPLRGV